jgi:uncharacterized membrane protein
MTGEHPGSVSRGTLGITLLVLGLTALAIYAPPSAFVTAPALVLSGFYVYRHSADGTLHTLGVMAIAIGLLLIAVMVTSVVFLPWVTPVGAS